MVFTSAFLHCEISQGNSSFTSSFGKEQDSASEKNRTLFLQSLQSLNLFETGESESGKDLSFVQVEELQCARALYWPRESRETRGCFAGIFLCMDSQKQKVVPSDVEEFCKSLDHS